MRTTAEGSADQQECHACPDPSTYILRPNEDECQTCPPGLTCDGSSTVQPVVANSIWLPDGAILKLQSCPSGYYVFPNSLVTLTAASAAQQQCEPCGKGEECTTASCVTCSPCQAGYYKAAVSTDSCVECPANRYGETPGATDLSLCQGCQLKSSTLLLTGRTNRRDCACDPDHYRIVTNPGSSEVLSCQICPKGAFCVDGKECALSNANFSCSDGSSIVGEWEVPVDITTGQYHLTSCPTGHSKKTISLDLQECQKCSSGQHYILHPDESDCQTCPPGLTCNGHADVLHVGSRGQHLEVIQLLVGLLCVSAIERSFQCCAAKVHALRQRGGVQQHNMQYLLPVPTGLLQGGGEHRSVRGVSRQHLPRGDRCRRHIKLRIVLSKVIDRGPGWPEQLEFVRV